MKSHICYKRGMRLRPRFAWLTLLGMAGSALGHEIGYLAAHPYHDERVAVLAHAGHGYWNVTLTVVGFGALTALAAELALSYLSARRGARSRPGFAATWATLCCVQMSLFVLVEVLERVASSASHPQLWQEPAFWLALPAQVLVAVLVALVLRGVIRIAFAMARRPGGLEHQSAAIPQIRPADVFLALLFASSVTTRAPPTRSI